MTALPRRNLLQTLCTGAVGLLVGIWPGRRAEAGPGLTDFKGTCNLATWATGSEGIGVTIYERIADNHIDGVNAFLKLYLVGAQEGQPPCFLSASREGTVLYIPEELRDTSTVSYFGLIGTPNGCDRKHTARFLIGPTDGYHLVRVYWDEEAGGERISLPVDLEAQPFIRWYKSQWPEKSRALLEAWSAQTS